MRKISASGQKSSENDKSKYSDNVCIEDGQAMFNAKENEEKTNI